MHSSPIETLIHCVWEMSVSSTLPQNKLQPCSPIRCLQLAIALVNIYLSHIIGSVTSHPFLTVYLHRHQRWGFRTLRSVLSAEKLNKSISRLKTEAIRRQAPLQSHDALHKAGWMDELLIAGGQIISENNKQV